MLRDEESLVRGLAAELELDREEALLYLKVLKEGELPKALGNRSTEVLSSRGMIILSGDNSRYIPVHPRLAIANYFRTHQEQVSRELRERRMRVDKLIFELIPVYEATIEKKLSRRGRK